ERTVRFAPRRRGEAVRHLLLNQEDHALRQWWRERLIDQRRGDVVGDVSDDLRAPSGIGYLVPGKKLMPVQFEGVPLHHLTPDTRSPIPQLLGEHTILFDCNDLNSSSEQSRVKPPCPGPTSMTVSPGEQSSASTILARI